MQGLSNANSSSEPRVGSSARQQILDAFHKRTIKQEPPSKEVRFGNAGPSLAVAKDETLKGFRGLGLGIQPAGGRAKGKVNVPDILLDVSTHCHSSDRPRKVE
ncbi:hypothetical protein PAXINDRAFT_170896 [Paxillus involutus ATCC 200175]|uniref:Uncharacterized protein n=1 Tax=Paxillus involutus ATCC 200175 TaxID=664439 RepID=A0A0C9TZL6_PAXIN|nr:hypothetical protein PAXINDRAFT_170896 [Paxillus involutus ATCC 200175]